MIEITSPDFPLTDAIKDEINALETVIEKHIPREEKIDVTLSKTSPTNFRVTIQSHFLGKQIVSHHESHNFHKALELCKDRFITLVEKRKGIKYGNKRGA